VISRGNFTDGYFRNELASFRKATDDDLSVDPKPNLSSHNVAGLLTCMAAFRLSRKIVTDRPKVNLDLKIGVDKL